MRPLSFALVLLLLFGFSGGPIKPDANIESITAQLVSEVQKDNIGSISISIIKNNAITYYKAYGPINRYNTFLPDTNTLYRIASVSKSFTSVLMLKLMEEGYFKLDDAIENYLPEVKKLRGYNDSTKITFRQLANHTSGIDRNSNIGSQQLGPTTDWENLTLQGINHTRFICKPNTKMSYSNIGYSILGLAMSRAAKTPYIKLINDKILQPLQMNNTFFDVPESKLKNLAAGTCDCGFMQHKNTRIPKKHHKGEGYHVPGGGFYSSASDLTKFLSLLMGTSKTKIISDQSLSLMQAGGMKYQDAIRRTFKDVEYGLGTVVYHLDDNRIVHAHSGSTEGYWATYAYDKTKNTAVLILLNYDKHLDNEGSVVKILNAL